MTLLFLLLMPLLVGCNDDGVLFPDLKRDDPGRQLPEIAPYLKSNASPADGRGRVQMHVDGDLRAGGRADFRFIFVTGEGGIGTDGFLLVQIPLWWGWSQPQNDIPAATGYVTVESDVPPEAYQLNILTSKRFLILAKDVIAEGSRFIIHYRNARVDRFREREERFFFFVDADGDGHHAPLDDLPKVRIQARGAARLIVTAPAIVRPGRAFPVLVSPVDPSGNWSRLVAGEYRIRLFKSGKKVRETGFVLRSDPENHRFRTILEDEGIFQISVVGPRLLSGTGNPVWSVDAEPQRELYFGDIHGHSNLSDGTGTPEDFYRYAREVSALDFAALTDHADHGILPLTEDAWRRIQAAAENAYIPQVFVTFPAFEWTSWKFGHRNVYFRNQGGPVLPALKKETSTPADIWRRLSAYSAMTIAHHSGGGPVPTDWEVKPHPMERLVEICSIHGSSEAAGTENAIYNPVPGRFIRDALKKGYRLGFIASGDTHDGHPGQRSDGAQVNGLVAVYAAELTRESIWEAMNNRHVYATSGPRTIVNFQVAGKPMGSELILNATRETVPIHYRVIAADDIAYIEIIRSGEIVFREEGNGLLAIGALEDRRPPAENVWYYLRMVQKNGQMAWSSPVWLLVDD